MVSIVRTNSDNKDFIDLVKLLDGELAKRDGDEHSFYAQFNKIAKIKYVVLAYENEAPVACGSIKRYDKKTVEIKRMFTTFQRRGNGLASQILAELELWASQLSYERIILETGIKQPEAIQLYSKRGYELSPNYGQYLRVKDSRCFQKIIG